MRPPLFLRLRFRDQRRRFGLWLPLFLALPLLLVFALVFLPLALVVGLLLWPFGWGRRLLLVGPMILLLLWALRGLRVDVGNSKKQVDISFR